MQARILNLLADLRDERQIADRIAVMYLGRVVEHGPAGQVIEEPAHPYTRALLSAVPRGLPGRERERRILAGDIPSGLNPPPGCPFHPRCPVAVDRCRTEVPALRTGTGDTGAACHLV
ncbi:oligopeptide/dipeptide ABC transporter ATP-binding protein [Sciscionella sediminilitoris]|uniref:oligopeptide/dipeptide ABC transporter ATP-binding protein n=1 Tax=Sciscionella sediminilitoris TaxID=1445613 RepID=UPI001E29E578|nr:ABC transporter ATP-binding protein [Sciscionella sp. SE31]